MNTILVTIAMTGSTIAGFILGVLWSNNNNNNNNFRF